MMFLINRVIYEIKNSNKKKAFLITIDQRIRICKMRVILKDFKDML